MTIAQIAQEEVRKSKRTPCRHWLKHRALRLLCLWRF
jgi:hypothetical protein